MYGTAKWIRLGFAFSAHLLFKEIEYPSIQSDREDYGFEMRTGVQLEWCAANKTVDPVFQKLHLVFFSRSYSSFWIAPFFSYELQCYLDQVGGGRWLFLPSTAFLVSFCFVVVVVVFLCVTWNTVPLSIILSVVLLAEMGHFDPLCVKAQWDPGIVERRKVGEG